MTNIEQLTSTPRTDEEVKCSPRKKVEVVEATFARELEEEIINLYTAKQYKERILEGIKMLTDPLMERIQEAEKKLDLQTKIVVDLEKRLMQ